MKDFDYHVSSQLMTTTTKLTPLMKQYWEVKNAHPDKVILFRMGDFYEMFHDDALTAAPVVGLALTKRNPKDETPMCGVPHHSAEGPVNKLLKAGYKVAICEQLEDPALAKGIVRRGVTRILTPGMVYDPDLIPSDAGNYICALDGDTVAFVDASTGEAFYYQLSFLAAKPVIEILKPSEFLLNSEFAERIDLSWLKSLATVTLRNFSNSTEEPSSCATLREYIGEAQGGIAPKAFELRHQQNKFVLSSQAIKHLEVFENNSGEKKATVFWAVDRTKTSIGARQLRRWLSFPEVRAEVIEDRLSRVEEWMKFEGLVDLRSQMATVGDIERRLGRLYISNSGARDLFALAQSLAASLDVYKKHLYQTAKINDEIFLKLESLSQKILATLREDLPISVREGGLIKKGIHRDLDELIDLTSDHAQLLQKIEQREREAAGISSLKVKYNAVFGYFIEITHTHKDKVPKHYIRKQTLASAERYTTDELISLEEKILSARGRRNDLEYEIFNLLREEIKNLSAAILTLSHSIAEFDVILAFAWLALEQNYVRPKILVKSGEFKLLSSRHPVIEQTQNNFIPNDIVIKQSDSILLTGPNMAGKSTLMRQVALASLLMQAGSFVPAREASLPLVTRILTRIGASDNLAEGLSTFMVEMKETAELLEVAEAGSLVVLDEIGRGTATFDGMALAQAILEHLHHTRRSTILFATHYHELAELEKEVPGIRNCHMAIREKNGEVKFLYQLSAGAAGKSYGIQVATLAGLPKDVIKRASVILKALEAKTVTAVTPQMDLFERISEGSVETELRDLDVNSLTPLAALNKISEWHLRIHQGSAN